MYSWIQDMLLRVLWGGLSQFEFLRGFSSGSNLTVNWGKRVPTNGKSNSNAKIYAAMEPKLQLLPRQRRNKKNRKNSFLGRWKKTDRSHIWQRNVLLDVLEPGSWCHSGPPNRVCPLWDLGAALGFKSISGVVAVSRPFIYGSDTF